MHCGSAETLVARKLVAAMTRRSDDVADDFVMAVSVGVMVWRVVLLSE